MSLNAQTSNQPCPTSHNPLTPKPDNDEPTDLLDPLSSSALNRPNTVDKSAIVQSIAKQEFREAQDQLLFLFPELKEPFQSTPLRDPLARREVSDVAMTPPNSTSSLRRPPIAPPSTPSNRVMSGVLWKRRDVFVRQWRPRWFMLYPEQGMLSYYLLTASYHPSPPTNPNSNGVVPNAISTTSISNNGQAITSISGISSTQLPSANSNGMSTTTTTPSTSNLPPLRSRTSSWDSVQRPASDNTMDYDVVPRGTIYLYNCTVSINDALSKPSEHMYVFTILQRQSTSMGTESSSHSIHLAARTEASRADWVSQIHAVCQSIHPHSSPVVGRGIPRRVATEPALPRSSRVAGTSESIQPRRLLLAPPSSGIDDQVTEGHEADSRSLRSSVTYRNWVPVDMSAALENVPPRLSQQIQAKIEKYRPLLTATVNNDNASGWKQMPTPDHPSHVANAMSFSNHRVFQRLDTESRCGMTLTTATIHHSVVRVFHLLMNIVERRNYEVNVAVDERMKQINPYTFLDYYAYKPVWPTTAREFTVVTHWQLIELNGERAIVILSFSCPEASCMRPQSSRFVRANLLVSAYVLRPVLRNGRDFCHFMRILSFDLAGNMNQQLSSIICTQQATIPSVIADFLQRQPTAFNEGKVDLVPEVLVSRVISLLPGAGYPSESFGILKVNSVHVDGSKTSYESAVSNFNTKPALELQFLILLLPAVLHWVLFRFNATIAGFVFCITAFLAVRQVVCWFIGRPLIQNEDPSVIGPVTCRFRVDLKGILRFISNKKEERVEMKSNHADISVIHIVASALALALKKEPILHTRKVSIPWLLINRVVDASKEHVDVSVSENGGGIVTLPCVDQFNIQEIADLHAAADKLTDRTNKVGNCLILAMSNYDDGEMVTDAVPFHQAVTVVAVLGGVHLERKESSQIRNSGTKDPPKPVLPLSLTITGSHQSADIVICRRFADEVRKLLVYPEICENSGSPVPVKS